MIFVSYLSNISHAAGTSAPYDEQLGMTLVQNYTALGYNVTAVAQTSGTSGTGPAYLLNGYSNTGYWYQVGLSWNWATSYFGYSPNEFLINYEVFAPNGTSIYPSGGGGGLLTLNGPVNEGDLVLLNLYFKNNTVIFLVKDWNTGATGSTTFQTYGATEFVGNPYSTASSQGFFTGLMTEWYGTSSSFPIQQPVVYSPYGAITSPAWLWADQFYCTYPCYQKSDVTSNVSSTYYYPTSSHYLTFTPGSTVEYSSGAIFTTGATPPAPFYLLSSNIKDLQTDEGTTFNYPINISVSGGTPPYTYEINIDGLPNLIQPVMSSQASTTIDLNIPTTCGRSPYNNSLACSITPGTYYYNVTVLDNEGHLVSSAEGHLQLNNPPQISLNAQKTTIDAGQELKANYNITGGTEPFNVSYFLNGKNIGSTLSIPNVGNYSVYARVIDYDGVIANSSQINFHVNRQPTLNVNYTRTITDINTPINLVAGANYGTQPYNYTWYINNESVSSSSTYIFTQGHPGDYIVFASLKDGAGYVVNSSQITIVVNSKPTVSGLKLLPSSSILYVNDSASGAITASGGTPPYSYKWYLNGVLQNDSNSPSYILMFDKTGSNNVTVEAIDTYGNAVQSSYTINTSYNYSLIIGIVVVVIVIIGSLVYLLVLRKPKSIGKKGNIKREDESIKTLKNRYAKGEITKKEFDKMRKDLE
jgi:uncharacterized membrane protein